MTEEEEKLATSLRLAPDWAIERALSRFPNPAFMDGRRWSIDLIRQQSVIYQQAVHFLAQQIASCEEPPTDPLLIEARQMVLDTLREEISQNFAHRIEAGLRDEDEFVRIAYRALRRGIELAEARK